MTATDGSFNSATEGLTATINITGWTVGSHTLHVRSKDAAGNWGLVTSTVLAVPDIIFMDTFEGATLVPPWTSKTDPGTVQLSLSAAAAMVGAQGLAATVNSNDTAFLTRNFAASEPEFHARFYFDPNGISTGTGRQTIFAGRSQSGTTLFQLQFRRQAGQHQVRITVLRGGNEDASAWLNITDSTHWFEFDWKSATLANGGGIRFWIDPADTLVAPTLTMNGNTSGNANNRWLRTIRLGLVNVTNTGGSGTEYFDSFVSTRLSRIGP
jgi:hypothetical protein